MNTLTKPCSCCKESKPLSEFHKDKKGKDGLSYSCGVCRNKGNTKSRLKIKYKIDLSYFNKLLLIQDSKCCICGCFMDKPYVDHDHSNGKVRGLLCRLCNVGLGHFRDNPEFLLNAANYLGVN